MKYFAILTIALLLQRHALGQAGSSCGSPYTIQLDGVTRTYATSSSNGSSVVCSTYSGSTPVTWFSFTTNASAQMPLLDLSVDDSTTCEIAMYTACNGGGILQTQSSMCFDDGWGLWAPAQNFALLANTTYHLRIKTAHSTQIRITAQSYSPPNNLCSGATPVDITPIHDNNACNKPSGEVTPAQLCAYTLENTAFYQFYVASAGNAIINVSSIACDNIDNNNDNGIQIGFFTGSCGALVPLNCAAGLGPFVQATTPSLDAGTKVYVAIDGNAGSNCQYTVQALNAYGVLALNEFKNFSAWMASSSTILKWTSHEEVNSYYEIERSEDGSEFTAIGRVNAGSVFKDVNYQFEDIMPVAHGFYRIKRINKEGKISMSNTIRVDRDDINGLRVKLINPAIQNLQMEISCQKPLVMEYAIVSIYGQVYSKGALQLKAGINKLNKQIPSIPKGQYILSVVSESGKNNYPFIKLD